MNDYFTLIAALGAPVLVGFGGLISWFLKARKEELQAIEERAMEKRFEIYTQILKPLIVLLSNAASEKDKNQATQEIASIAYRKSAFNLITFGSDQLVIAYNEMMQGFFTGEADINPKMSLKRFANFILAIRKDLYSKQTKLKEWDMLKFMITDIDKIID